jgi:hypothetical protein
MPTGSISNPIKRMGYKSFPTKGEKKRTNPTRRERLNVKKIVMLTDSTEQDDFLIACLQILFPECEIRVNPPGSGWPEKDTSFGCP